MAIKKMADIVELGKAWWIDLGAELVDFMFIYTTEKRLDVDGKKFKSLSEPYASRKSQGKYRRQSSTAGANLELTGDMMSDLQSRRASDKSVEVGWSAQESQKVVGNADNGRTITRKDKPVAKATEKMIQKLIDKQTKKNIKKNDTVTIIKLGK